jgi:hypothetical protein
MPLKRITPSFTVEYRQAKRANSGSAKPGWAHAKPALPVFDEKANRIAISAFRTDTAKPLADVISLPRPSGRILPSLLETAHVMGQAAAAQSKGYRGTGQAPVDGTVARQLGEDVCPAEDLEPSIAVATILRVKRRMTSEASAVKARTPRSEKRTRRPAEKQEKLDNAPKASAERCESAPVSSTPGLPPVSKPSSTTRTSQILDRYVFRDERGPGESWKRRIEARRERRA